jgi:Tol biopolymer transport system component
MDRIAGGGKPEADYAGGSRREVGVKSAFSWSPDGKSVALAMDGGVGVVDANDGSWRELARGPVRPEACVFSPKGDQIAYSRVVAGHNQIFTADFK